jgi:hypothetical protein
MDSPSNKLKNNGRKNDNMEDVLNDTHDFYANIFEKRERPDGVSIENFLGDLRHKPEDREKSSQMKKKQKQTRK